MGGDTWGKNSDDLRYFELRFFRLKKKWSWYNTVSTSKTSSHCNRKVVGSDSAYNNSGMADYSPEKTWKQATSGDFFVLATLVTETMSKRPASARVSQHSQNSWISAARTCAGAATTADGNRVCSVIEVLSKCGSKQESTRTPEPPDQNARRQQEELCRSADIAQEAREQARAYRSNTSKGWVWWAKKNEKSKPFVIMYIFKARRETFSMFSVT